MTRYQGKPRCHAKRHAAKTTMGLDVWRRARISRFGTKDGVLKHSRRNREASKAAQTAVAGTMTKSTGK